MSDGLKFQPLTPERWPDVVRLFGSNGANSMWTGAASTFRKAGFSEIARRTPTRPIMRIEVSRPT